MLGHAFNLQIENKPDTLRDLSWIFLFLQIVLHHGKRSNINTDSAVKEIITFKVICGFLPVSFQFELHRVHTLTHTQAQANTHARL